MKKTVGIKSLLCIVTFLSIGVMAIGAEEPAISDLQKSIEQIDTLFVNGHKVNYQKSGMDIIKQSLDLALKSNEKYPNNYEVLWRCARSSGGYAEAANGIPVENWKPICKKWGKKGMEFAGQAIEIDPKRVEAYFWQTQAIGKYADATGIMTAIKEGFLKKIKRNLKLSYEIDKSYMDYSPIFSNAMFNYNLPRFFGRDNEKALKYLKEYDELSVWEFEPYIRRPFAARVFMRFKDDASKAEAKLMLEKALEVPNPRKYYHDLTTELMANLK